jgi:CBS domain-containing protein
MIGHDETLSEILAGKGSNVYHVEPETTVTEAVALMNLKNIGALLVMSGDRVVGIFTERDALTRIIGAGRDPTQTHINDVMSTKLAVVHPSTTVEEAMLIVTEKRFRHLPVMDGDQLKGMVSIGDLTRWLVRVDESYIDNLLSYISGQYPG